MGCGLETDHVGARSCGILHTEVTANHGYGVINVVLGPGAGSRLPAGNPHFQRCLPRRLTFPARRSLPDRNAGLKAHRSEGCREQEAKDFSKSETDLLDVVVLACQQPEIGGYSLQPESHRHIHHSGRRVLLGLLKILTRSKGPKSAELQAESSSHASNSSCCNQQMSKATRRWTSSRCGEALLESLKQPPPDPPYWTARFQRFSRGWVLDRQAVAVGHSACR